jgi:hypothetical protein
MDLKKEINEAIGKHLNVMVEGFLKSQLTKKGREQYQWVLEEFVKFVQNGGEDITMKN